MKIIELIFFLSIFTTGCTEKSQQPKVITKIQNNISSNKPEEDSLKKGIDFGTDYGAIIRSDHGQCSDSVWKLITSSKFLEIAGYKEKKWKKKWEKTGAFTTELHDSGFVYIRAFFDNTGGTGTIGWLSIDSTKKQFSYVSSDEPISITCDSILLKYIIDHCIDWNKK